MEIAATVRTTGRTGVEMEALTAASVAALTVYDMCKAVDRGMRIEAIRLTAKAGGKSGDVPAGLGHEPMISVEEARARILADLRPVPAESGCPRRRLGPRDRRPGSGAADPAAGRCLGDGRLRAARRGRGGRREPAT